jgi:hypothetical protein
VVQLFGYDPPHSSEPVGQMAMAATPELTLLAHDPRTEAVVPDINRFRVLRRPSRQIAARARNIFVIVPATDLPDVSEFVSAANRRH